MSGRALLDTSALLRLGEVIDPSRLPGELFISTITLAELSAGPLLASDDESRAARQAHLQQAEADFDALPFDSSAARAFGRVSSALRSSGRKPAARAFDALIASVALAHRLPVMTANPKDFTGIPDLQLLPLPAGERSPWRGMAATATR